MGYKTLLDAAALATTSQINLTETPVDAMAVSFYKMFGFPTGVGALVVKEEFLSSLQRPWFAGGTVDVVQVPGSIVTMAEDVREQFEVSTTFMLVRAIALKASIFLGWHDQLPESSSCHARITVPFNIPTVPSNTTVSITTPPHIEPREPAP